MKNGASPFLFVQFLIQIGDSFLSCAFILS